MLKLDSKCFLTRALFYVGFGIASTAPTRKSAACSAAELSGEANVKIEPSLRSTIETINNDDAVIYLNTTTIMRLDSNEFNWDTNKVSNYGISFACSEVL